MTLFKRLLLATALTAATAAAAHAQDDTIKIGYITTLTTPASIIGREQQDAVNLALEHIGGEIGGKKVEIIFEDDGVKPDLGRQKAEKLIQQDDVDVVAGFIWTNVLLAALKPVLDSGKILISNNAGPSDIAGKRCHENFFSTRAQNDMLPRALGETMNKDGMKTLYIMAPNYAGGQDMVSGGTATFKGEVIGTDYTKWGADPQLDFSAELAKVKASGADALYVFYPGSAAGAFVKQFAQSGLSEQIKLYSAFTIDQITLPIFQQADVQAVLGTRLADYWSPDLDNEVNRKFVADFKAKYGRLPSNYAAAAYDLLPYLKAAVEQSGGDISDTEAVRAALKKADYPSVRGSYELANNGFPIDKFYSLTTVEGDIWTTQTDELVLEGEPDPYAKDCPLP